MANFSCDISNDSPVWGTFELLRWKLLPKKLGGGIPYIQSFKNGWIRINKNYIKHAAIKYKLPPNLLAGVCWIEVGGDPDFIDRIAFDVRSFDWMGPEWMDKYLTVTRHPQKTSFGAVSIQLRTAAETLGLDHDKISHSELGDLINCLKKDVFNIDIVAKHLLQLIAKDGFEKSLPNLTMDQIIIIGARYNRGIGLSIDQINKNTSYGNFIVKEWLRFSLLLA